MTTTLREAGENSLLAWFARTMKAGGSLRVGPGDDCAVTRSHGDDILLKTDALVEGVHFTAGEDPTRVGHKAVARVFSDIGAMGGTPTHLLVTLVLPATTTVDWLEDFYCGARALADSHICRIAGGELATMPAGGAIVISIAATGRIARDHAILRCGGMSGDIVAVTGVLGGSFASGHHLDFLPRLAEGQWLARQHGVHAMMDLSDGLAKDLPRLALASQCGFSLSAGALPVRAGHTVAQAIGDGEDYELLVAIAPIIWPTLKKHWRESFPNLPLTAIGMLTDILPAPTNDLSGGWEHFR